MTARKFVTAVALGLGLTLIILGLVTHPALATNFTVTKLTDTNDGACNADCSLREAIRVANANNQVDTITLMTGTHTLTRTGPDDDANNGDLDITGPLTITGRGPAVTIIDASKLDDRVFHLLAAGTVVISGVTLRGGSAGFPGGGGIASNGSELTLINTIIRNNTTQTPYDGGGIYFTNGSLTFRSGQIRNNTANDGGGIYLVFGQMTWRGGQILSNTAHFKGGGVRVAGSGTTFTQIGATIMAGNTADAGGGMSVSDGSLILSGGQILTNTSRSNGGGVFITGNSFLTQTNATIIAGNIAQLGGGLFVEAGRVTLSGGRMLNNAATNGGGLYKSSGTVNIANSCIVNNSNTGVVRAGGHQLIARQNWWGAASGPAGSGPGGGDSVSANVDFANFLTAPPTGCPSRTVFNRLMYLPLILKTP